MSARILRREARYRENVLMETPARSANSDLYIAFGIDVVFEVNKRQIRYVSQCETVINKVDFASLLL